MLSFENPKFRNLVKGLSLLFVVLLSGTFGYHFLTDGKYSLVDCFYMTVITITTVGFEEVVNLEGNTVGRLFTVFLAFAGITLASYIFLNLASLFVEGEITEFLKGKRMERKIKELEGHYIVCGVGWLGFYVARELEMRKKKYIIVDIDRSKIESFLESHPNALWVVGDATEDLTLERAGIHRAKGIFITTRDDSKNLMIALTARLLNPSLKIVVHCANVENEGKFKKVGVDRIVTSQFVGGRHMVTEMIKPSVAKLFDTILSGELEDIKMKEIKVDERYSGKTVEQMLGEIGKEFIPIAIKKGETWFFNPSASFKLEGGEVLILLPKLEEGK